MIKLMRDAAHNYPWLLKSVMGVLAIAFVITMGWWGFGQPDGNVVATIGGLTISRDEFRRAYENAYRFYKDKGSSELKDEMLKEIILQQLIENRLWLVAAHQMGLTVSDEDLREAILQVPEFQRQGKFDPDVYRQLLAANHLTPAAFEAVETKELLGNKARMLIRDAVALTPSEVAEAQALVARRPTTNIAENGQSKERAFQDVLFQKQMRALQAYTESLKTSVPIKIHKELL